MEAQRIYDQVAMNCSRFATRAYSTSFSLGILCLKRNLRNPIYAIYGFVRFADEIVDTFSGHDKRKLLSQFKEDTYRAINEGISLNPILHSFQSTVRKYHIDLSSIELFLSSMEMDLERKTHDVKSLNKYILGSAEVVGLMCLRVFVNGDDEQYQQLKPYAMRLGSAFQKINFLRDIRADYHQLGRSYFPHIDVGQFNDEEKRKIELSILQDFEEGLTGIKLLPGSSRFGVYVAYVYYFALFRKIQNTPSQLILNRRIRIANRHKARLLAYSFFKHRFNLI